MWARLQLFAYMLVQAKSIAPRASCHGPHGSKQKQSAGTRQERIRKNSSTRVRRNLVEDPCWLHLVCKPAQANNCLLARKFRFLLLQSSKVLARPIKRCCKSKSELHFARGNLEAGAGSNMSWRLDHDAHLGHGLLDLWVHWAILDATLTVTGDAPLDAQVALLSPGGPPGVLHLPILNAVVDAVTDHEHTVVQLGAAPVLDDTALVELEDGLVRLDGDRHRLLRNGLHQGVGVLVIDVFVAGHAALRDARGARALGASAVLGRICVAVLGAHILVLEVLERRVHAAAVAAHVAILRAINQLLLAEGLELAGGDLPSALDGTSGGETPARAALALILHRRHRALRGPVDGIGELRAAPLVRAEVRHVAHGPPQHGRAAHAEVL
mmetsp:Transcript_23004/g.58609  ORF Transcript_23004/g.58609 Transcript_23004/m.58609 type:complete len:383 (-) Transcript_23004:332-1480(-)